MDLSVDVGSIFSDALTEITSTVTGLKLSVTSEETDLDFDEISGFMSIYGRKSGFLFVSATEEVFRILCSKMTGMSDDEITRDDAEDIACEIVNMTGGNAKVRLMNTEDAFDITQPIVTTGDKMTLIAKRKTHVISRTLSADAVSLKLKIVF